MEEEKKKEGKYSKIDEETLKKLKEVADHFPPALTAEQNLELLERYKETGDIEIRNAIVCGNLRLGVYLSYKNFLNLVNRFYKNQHDELVQDLSLWLMDAVEKFDLSKGFSFSTFVGGVIRKQFLLKNLETKRLKNSAWIVLFSSPIRANQKDDKLIYADMLADEKFTEENFATSIDVKFILKKIVPRLPERERTIFKQYFIERKSQGEIAETLNFSQAGVSRLITRIRTKILDAYENGIENLVVQENAPKTFEEALSRQKVRNQGVLKDYFVGVLMVKEIAQKYDIAEVMVYIVVKKFKTFCEERNIKLPARIKPLSPSAQKKKERDLAALRQAERNNQIWADFLQGNMTQGAIGKKYSMTTSNVRYILSKFKEKAKEEGEQTQMQVKTPQQPLHKQ